MRDPSPPRLPRALAVLQSPAVAMLATALAAYGLARAFPSAVFARGAAQPIPSLLWRGSRASGAPS